MSDAAEIRSLTRRFYEEFWTRGNAAAADELVAADLVHEQLPPGWPHGRDGLKRLVRVWRDGFPDMREDIELMIVEGQWVAARFRLRGTHRGDFYGIAAIHRPVDIRGVDLLRFDHGVIAEWIYYEDTLGVFEQLGARPPDVLSVAH